MGGGERVSGRGMGMTDSGREKGVPETVLWSVCTPKIHMLKS
jgi:hypothetical protein